MSRYFVFVIAFCSGNFVWQALTGKDYAVAAERTYFEAAFAFFAWMCGFIK